MIKCIAVAIALAVAPVALAQTYIVPDGDCGAITFHVTRGADFPNLGETIDPIRVKDAHVYLPKRRIVVNAAAGARSLEFNANIPDDDVVMASVGFTSEVSGNETRTEHAKALVRCGAIARDDDWQRSTGLGLEIFPQWNGLMPLKPGDSMLFIAVDMASRKVIHDVSMELYRSGAGRVAGGVRDEIGGMNFPYQEPGLYMVAATYRRADPQKPDHWLVDTSTLTLELK